MLKNLRLSSDPVRSYDPSGTVSVTQDYRPSARRAKTADQAWLKRADQTTVTPCLRLGNYVNPICQIPSRRVHAVTSCCMISLGFQPEIPRVPHPPTFSASAGRTKAGRLGEPRRSFAPGCAPRTAPRKRSARVPFGWPRYRGCTISTHPT